MPQFLFEPTVKCTVWVEADTEEEAMNIVEEMNPLDDDCHQDYEEWELIEEMEEQD